VSTCPELIVELHEEVVFFIGPQLVNYLMVRYDVLLCPVLEIPLQSVVPGHLADGLEVLLQGLLLLPHLRQSVPHLVEEVPKTHHARDLYEDHHSHFASISRSDVSVADSQHGRAGEVEGIEVLLVDGGVGYADGDGPVVVWADFGGAEHEYGLDKSAVTKMWACMKMFRRRSKIFSWFSYFRAKDFSLMFW
jgi:hypothetical protein